MTLGFAINLIWFNLSNYQFHIGKFDRLTHASLTKDTDDFTNKLTPYWDIKQI